MSCGSPHETPCTEVLEAVYTYLDNEDCRVDRALIKAHLDECGPCEDEFSIEGVLKALISRSCCGEPAPDDVKSRVLAEIAQIQVQITRVQLHSD